MGKSTLVILHGWGLHGEAFAPLVDVFRKHGFRVMAPDFPGFGKAQMPDHAFMLSDYVSFLHQYLRDQKITRPVLIGHSFGGRVALQYQAAYPNEVAALVLSGTPGFTPVPAKKLFLFIALAKVGNIVFSLPPLSLFQDTIRKWYYYVVGARDFFRAEGVMRETFKNIVQEKLVAAMEQVTVPTLLLWGELDILVPVAIASRMEQVIPTAKLIVIPDADHGVPFKQPEIFSSYVEKFLKTV